MAPFNQNLQTSKDCNSLWTGEFFWTDVLESASNPAYHELTSILRMEKANLLCLGSTIYHIITRQEVLPELSSDGNEEEIQRRFQEGKILEYDYIFSDITVRCWPQKHDSSEELIRHSEAIVPDVVKHENKIQI